MTCLFVFAQNPASLSSRHIPRQISVLIIRVKDFFKNHAPRSQVYFVFISSHPLRPTPSHFHPRPSSLSFLYALMGFMVAVPLPSVSQSIWLHFLPVGPPPRAKTHLRKRRTSRSSAVVTALQTVNLSASQKFCREEFGY